MSDMSHSNVPSVRRLLQVMALTLLAHVGAAGIAAAQDVAIITREGQKEMLKDPGTPPAGAKTPDVIIVEYFDYNCPYCKKLVPTLQTLLSQDPKIAVVYKEWPILGPVSQYAANEALAAGYQGKYLAAHDALISGPRLANNGQVDAILQKVGVDMDTLAKDRTAHAAQIAALLKRNDEEAHALTLQGTPGVVVGRQLVAGIADAPLFTQLIANARHGK
jgi:protein-disulfide isomerase